MTLSPRLGFTQLEENQALPEQTVNEGLLRVEQGANSMIVKDKDLTAPPGSPAEGDAYIVGASATGDWAGKDEYLTFYASGWIFIAPIEGTRAYAQDENIWYQYDGANWVADPTGTAGKHSIPIMASAMKSRTTLGAASGSSETSTNKIVYQTLDFDDTADEFAQFQFPMPKRWNEGTITAQFIWTAAATGNVVWGIQAVAISDDDPIDAAFGTAVTVTDGVTAANDLMQSAATGAVTVGGTPAEGDLVIVQIYRDADNGSDTLTGDAKLIGIRLFITTNAETDD